MINPEARQTFTLIAAVNTSGVIEGTPGIYVDTDTFYLAWVVLHAARDLYGATHYIEGTAVTAPPFFATAARSDALFWHPDPKCVPGAPADSPLDRI